MSTGELVHELRLQLWNVTYARYLNQELFSYQWWGILIMLFISYSLWWKLADKSRLVELLLFGSYVAVSSTVVDIWGVTTAHWQYNIRIFPILPAPFPFDYTVIPILLMLAYQYGKDWRQYLFWAAIGSAVFSFIMSPIFAVTGIKTFFQWNFAYFFIIMLIIGVVSRVFILLTIQVMENARKKDSIQ